MNLFTHQLVASMYQLIFDESVKFTVECVIVESAFNSKISISTLRYHFISYHITPHYTILHHTILHQTILHHALFDHIYGTAKLNFVSYFNSNISSHTVIPIPMLILVKLVFISLFNILLLLVLLLFLVLHFCLFIMKHPHLITLFTQNVIISFALH